MKFAQLKLVLISTLLVIAVVGCQELPSATSNNRATNSVWTGFLQGDSLDVSSQVGGQLAMVAVEEGATVQAGQPLFTLQDDLVRTRLDIADANVAAAQAQLAMLKVGARSEDIHRAEARVEQANAGLIAATQALSDTEAIRANPQLLLITKAQAELRVADAQQQFTQALKQAEAADLEHQFWQTQTEILTSGADIILPDGTTRHFNTPANRLTYVQSQTTLAGDKAWQAWAGVTAAQANLDAAQAALGDVLDQTNNPLVLDAQVEQARGARDRAAANLQTARAALQVLRDGASRAQMQAAQAALDQAIAARAELEQELARYRVDAPRAGIVTDVFYRQGEVIAPSVPVVRLSIGGDLTLRVFVAMSSLSNVQIGQNVNVFVNELNKPYAATVTRIADSAEFTARQAQTDNERNAQLVAVEATIKNPDSQVKAGMPASFSFNGQAADLIAIAADASNPSNPLTLSGSLEARQTRIAPELSGNVKAVQVSVGDMVHAGDTLLELDDSELQTSLNQAEATVRQAQSNLDQVKESARPGAIALAQAGVTQAQADLDAASSALDIANRTLASQQETTAQIHAWEGKVAAAQSNITSSQAALANLDSQFALAANDLSMAGKAHLAILQKQREAANASLGAAKETLTASQSILDLYRALLANPLELLASQHSAANQVQVAQAGLQVAQGGLEIVNRAPQPEAVALAQAKLDSSQAALNLVQAQIKRLTLTSPTDGAIITRDTNAGETARAGVPLIAIAETRELEMTLYAPIRQLSVIKLGQSITVKLPSLPGETFNAQVTFIAPQGEFEPANIYNSQERAEVVFAVKIVVPNPSGELKAGLPADAVWQ